MVRFFNPMTWLILIISSTLISPAVSFDIRQTGLTCGSFQYPGPSAANLTKSFMVVMDAVSFQVKEHGWGAETLLGSWHPIYALGQCHGDLNATQCYTCFTRARQLLSRCIPKTGGRIYLDTCFLRYENYSFFRESMDPSRDMNVCGSPKTKGKDEAGDGFSERVASMILNVTTSAVANRFAVSEGEGVFGLAQCWKTVNKGNCEKCLREAGKKVQECLPRTEGRSLFTGCFLRYSNHMFYNVNDDLIENDIEDPKGRPSVWFVACVILLIVVVFLFILSSFLIRKRIASRGKRIHHFGETPGFVYLDGFSYRYDLLEKATNYFDPANKLGHSTGAGSVFKATLPSGKTVAVKRLFFNPQQWTKEFFNDINLFKGIQHKNVVKLLGCSIEGPESLLVYEFVPSRILDQVLFGKDSENALNWEQRFQIICGIAEGLAYLHGGSGTKIIHRDIKSSNILLDENLNPKIADFGLTRCVAGNKSHLGTGIAGTQEYMAPEYLNEGQLTEKADIYAFGVLIVEIVCGKKNNVCIPGSTSLLHSVWKNYKANGITTSVDPALHGKIKIKEASNALQVGLLCTQYSATLRPSMSEIVQMLTKENYVIPSPKQQPFLNTTALSLVDGNVTSTASNKLSNGHLSPRSSFHSTTSSLIPSEDLLVLEKPLSSSARFTTIGAPEPR